MCSGIGENISVTVSSETASLKGLTVNYMQSPVGIESGSIRFEWQMDYNVIGERQIVYRIQVYTEDNSPVWDSGRGEESI